MRVNVDDCDRMDGADDVMGEDYRDKSTGLR